VVVFKEHADSAQAIAFAADGRLYASQPVRKRIVSYGPGGDEKVAAQNVDADRLAITARGDIYYTDAAHKSVGRIDAKGQKHTAYSGGEIGAPAGLALSPDQAMLLVTDSEARFSWSFQLAADGSLVNGEPFYRLEIPETASHHGATSVTSDAIGQVYFATPLGIQICEANGRVATILNNPELESVSNVIFGGKGLDLLYVTSGGKLFRRPVKQTGVAAWSPIKPPKPPL
jgi:sugar lactone lactonase YvrE